MNGQGQALDMVQASGHLQHVDEDYARAADAGLSCVRESIGWRIAEDALGRITLDRAKRINECAARHGIQVLWTLMHYGVPPGLSLHDDALIDRFERFAVRVVETLGGCGPSAPVFTPINEMSFLAWAASQPHLLDPINSTDSSDHAFIRSRGYAVKRRLVAAAIRAMAAMRAVNPACRFMHAEPLTQVVAPRMRPDLEPKARNVNEWQWQVWDMLSGRECPELQGDPSFIDLMGLNHYHNSQWELETGQELSWHMRDPRRLALSQLLAVVWERYHAPVMVAETGHVGCGRGPWLHEVAGAVADAVANGIPVHALCVYPLVDRPDWNNREHWHRSGLWHVDDQSTGLHRMVIQEYAHALHSWQQILPNPPVRTQRVLVVVSHRPWDVAKHRTQQLVLGLGPLWRVVWVEGFLQSEGSPRMDVVRASPEVSLLAPRMGSAGDCDGSARVAWLADQVRSQLFREDLVADVLWMSSPEALPLAKALKCPCTVYDAGGGHEPRPEASASEEEVLRAVDLIVCESLPTARRLRGRTSKNVHVISNGAHTEATGLPSCNSPATGWASMEAHHLQRGLKPIRVGCIGNFTPCLDAALLARVSALRPEWSFVMVGTLPSPTDLQALENRTNVVWLNAQPSELLPALMATWTMAWMPWKNAGQGMTGCPTQALECLAHGLPLVAPPISDLLRLQGTGVRFARSGNTHLRQLDRCIALTPQQRVRERAIARQRLHGRTWQRAALHMNSLMLKALECPR